MGDMRAPGFQRYVPPLVVSTIATPLVYDSSRACLARLQASKLGRERGGDGKSGEGRWLWRSCAHRDVRRHVAPILSCLLADNVAQCAISGRRKGGDCVIAIVRQFLLLVLLESLDDFHMSS